MGRSEHAATGQPGFQTDALLAVRRCCAAAGERPGNAEGAAIVERIMELFVVFGRRRIAKLLFLLASPAGFEPAYLP